MKLTGTRGPMGSMTDRVDDIHQFFINLLVHIDPPMVTAYTYYYCWFISTYFIMHCSENKKNKKNLINHFPGKKKKRVEYSNIFS